MACGGDVVERFLRHVRKTDDCWLWTGWTAGTKSTYGYFRPGTKSTDPHMLAHRFSYEAHVGPIPDGLQIDHLCRTPLCVRPDHLEAVTPEENNRRRRQSLCKSGRHDLNDPANQIWRGTHRTCRECRREWDRERYRRTGDRHRSRSGG